MTDQSIEDQVRGIASDIFNAPIEEITLASSPDSIHIWDSFEHVNLVLALEQHFSMQFEPEEVAEMLNIELIVSIIEEKLDGRN